MGSPDVGKLASQVKALEKEVSQLRSWQKTTLKFLDQEQKRMDTVEKKIDQIQKTQTEMQKSIAESGKRAADDAKRFDQTVKTLEQEKKRVDTLEASTKKTEGEDLLYRAKHNNAQLVAAKKVIDALTARVVKLEKSAR